MKQKKLGDFLIPMIAAVFVAISMEFLMEESVNLVDFYIIYMLLIISWDLEGVKRVINRD